MGLYGLEHVSDLSKELRERTCDLERHVLKLQTQHGSRVHVRRPRLACSGDDCDEGAGAGPEGDAQDGTYDDSNVPSLSHDNQLHSFYAYFNTGFAMITICRR
jgi:hypothetical protein